MITKVFTYNGTTKTVPVITDDVSTVTNVIIKEGFEIIPANCFSSYSNLNEISLPDSLLTIQDEAFSNVKLVNITLGPNVRDIHIDNPFDNSIQLQNIFVSSSNKYLTSDDGILFSDDKTILYCIPPAKNITFYIVPNTVHTIATCGIAKSKIEYVIIPSSVKTIRINFLKECKMLKRVVIFYNYNIPKLDSSTLAMSSLKISDIEFIRQLIVTPKLNYACNFLNFHVFILMYLIP